VIKLLPISQVNKVFLKAVDSSISLNEIISLAAAFYLHCLIKVAFLQGQRKSR